MGEMRKRGGRQGGFTLVEMLVVVAIIAILAGILVPTVNGGLKSAKKRRAEVECQNIETAVRQFQSDFRYMPWGNYNDKKKMGDDQWAEESGNQKKVMSFLQGSNVLQKIYLEIPDSGKGDGVFYDPWGKPYVIGMDRNGDGQLKWNGKTYKLAVMVYSYGPDGQEKTKDDILSFDKDSGE